MSTNDYTAEVYGSPVHAARAALTEGLSRLRMSMDDMLSLAVRGDGGSKRTRNRPHPNEAPTRQTAPGGNVRPIAGGRVASPTRPAMPAQPGSGPPAEDGGRGGTDGETALLPVVPAAEPATGSGGQPTGYPSRPDPSDPATDIGRISKGKLLRGPCDQIGPIRRIRPPRCGRSSNGPSPVIRRRSG